MQVEFDVQHLLSTNFLCIYMLYAFFRYAGDDGSEHYRRFPLCHCGSYGYLHGTEGGYRLRCCTSTTAKCCDLHLYLIFCDYCGAPPCVNGKYLLQWKHSTWVKKCLSTTVCGICEVYIYDTSVFFREQIMTGGGQIEKKSGNLKVQLLPRTYANLAKRENKYLR